MGLNNINSKSTWGQAASDINTNFTTIDSDLKKVKNATTRNKGYFSTSSELISAFPTASKGDIAYVGSSYPYDIWKWNGSSWANSGSTGGEESVNLGNYHTAEYVDEKLSELSEEVSILGTTFELGDVNGGNGDLISGGKTLRSGFAKCYAGVNYKVSTSVAESNIGYIYFYDENKKFIKMEKLTYYFTPETSGYFVVVLGSGYGTIFKNDIAIFQQDGWRPDVANLIERIDNTNTELAATYQNMGDNLLTSSFELGDIGTGQGTPSDATSVIRTKDFCRCNKGTLLFVRPTINIARLGAIYWYDANQKYIKFDLLDYNEVETPDNALYFKIVLERSYGTTFNNDIRVLQKVESVTL